MRFCIYGLFISAVTIAMVMFANASMERRHKSIIEAHYAELTDFRALIKEEIEVIRDTTVSESQRFEFLKRMRGHIESLREDRESDRVNHLLELELSKIQGEYEVLNLWCALLTVVFLVFSLYSIIRTNELHNQADQALLNLNRIKREAEEKSASIDTAVKDAEKTVTDRLKEIAKGPEQRMNDLEKRVNDAESKITTAEGTVSDLSDRSNTLDLKIKDIEKHFSEDVNAMVELAKQESFMSLETAKKEISDGLIRKLQELEEKINSLRQDIESGMIQNDSIGIRPETGIPRIEAGTDLEDE